MIYFEFPQKSAIQNSFVIKMLSGDKSFLRQKRIFLKNVETNLKTNRYKAIQNQFYMINFLGTLGFHSLLKYLCIQSR